MDSAARFRSKAAECRALAKLARDSMTAKNLRALADDYEVQARLLERVEPSLPRPE